MTGWPGLVLAAVLVVGNGFFVAVEFGLLAARQTLLVQQAERSSSARVALSASRRLPLMIAGCQFGITLCSLGLGAVGEPALAHVIEPVFEAAGLPEGLLHPVAFVLALTVMSVAHMLLGEMVPKNIALAAPEATASVLSRPLLGFIAVFRLVIAGLTRAASLVLRALGVEEVPEGHATYTPEQISRLIHESGREGLLEPQPLRQVTGALRFQQVPVGSLVLPHDDVVAAPEGITATGLEQLVGETGFSRFPVAAADGGWLGYVHVSDALGARGRARSAPLAVRPLPVLEADLPLRVAATRLQRSGAHLAEVRDADGEAGLVMLEDLLEELVGEVHDELSAQL